MDFWFWLKVLVAIAILAMAVAAIRRLLEWLRHQYRALLEWLVDRRKWVIAGAVVSIVAPGLFLVLPRLVRPPPLIVSAPVELEAALKSGWTVTASNGVRASVGIALTPAAARGEAEGATWQNWFVASDSVAVAERLAPNRSYAFNLALTPGKVQLAGAQSTIASAAAQEAILRTLQTGKPVQLSAIFIADPEKIVLQQGESAEKTFTIDVPRLLQGRQQERRPASSMGAGLTRVSYEVAGLAERPAAAASSPDGRDPHGAALATLIERAFGQVTFKVKTGSAEGWTKASVVLLANNRPIDQVVTTQCIGQCADPMPTGRVPGSPRLYALLQEAPPADISLFLTELEPARLHSVLVSREPVDGRSVWIWDTTRAAPGFANFLSKTISKLYKDIESREELLRKGLTLSDLLFADTDQGRQALRAFGQLLARSSRWQQGDGAAPKSLFVHFDFAATDEGPTIVPVGLMTFTDAQGQPEFVGRHLMIEQPMRLPRYGPSSRRNHRAWRR
jgi:hypothetical protein